MNAVFENKGEIFEGKIVSIIGDHCGSRLITMKFHFLVRLSHDFKKLCNIQFLDAALGDHFYRCSL